MGVLVLTGSDAFAWLTSCRHRERWYWLLGNCDCNNPFLRPDYLDVWLKYYGSGLDLVLVVGTDVTGQTCAILPLQYRDHRLTGLGSWHAEYQGWVCSAESGPQFIRNSLAALRELYPDTTLELEYVLQGRCTDTLQALADTDRCAQITALHRPLLALDSRAIESVLGKKGNRSKLNRLKRTGAVRLLTLRSAEDFQRYMEDVFNLYDLRQGAHRGECPFYEDTVRREFHSKWYEQCPDRLCVNLLLLDDRPVSAYFGAIVGTTVSNILVAYDPRYAKHSISKLHIYLFAQSLCDSGFTHLDLTPGDDWKDRFATEFEPVLEFRYWFNASQLRARERRKLPVRAARKLAAVLNLDWNNVRRLRGDSRRRLSGGTRKKTVTVKSPSNYRMVETSLDSLKTCYSEHLQGRAQAVLAASVVINAGAHSYADLVRFEPTDGRQEFLADCYARLARGQQICSVTVDGKLRLVLCCASWAETERIARKTVSETSGVTDSNLPAAQTDGVTSEGMRSPFPANAIVVDACHNSLQPLAQIGHANIVLAAVCKLMVNCSSDFAGVESSGKPDYSLTILLSAEILPEPVALSIPGLVSPELLKTQ